MYQHFVAAGTGPIDERADLALIGQDGERQGLCEGAEAGGDGAATTAEVIEDDGDITGAAPRRVGREADGGGLDAGKTAADLDLAPALGGAEDLAPEH